MVYTILYESSGKLMSRHLHLSLLSRHCDVEYIHGSFCVLKDEQKQQGYAQNRAVTEMKTGLIGFCHILSSIKRC